MLTPFGNKKLRLLRTGLLGLLFASLPVWAASSTSTALTAMEAQKAVDAAVDFFMNLLSKQADNYYGAGDYDNAVRILKLQMGLDPHWIEAYDSAAWLLWSMERLEEAVAVYKQGIAANPDNYQLYFELGTIYWRTARPSIYKSSEQEARKLSEKAAEQLYLAVEHGAPVTVQRLLATVLHSLGRYAEERKVIEEVLKKNPTDGVALRKLQQLEQMGQ
jgi:tetratricopeptide (TPR) repeat protein